MTKAFDKISAGLQQARGHAQGRAVKGLKVTYASYETAAFLGNETVIAEYLTAAAEDGNPELLRKAEANVAKARGKMKAAKDTG